MIDLDNISADTWAKEMGSPSPGAVTTTSGTGPTVPTTEAELPPPVAEATPVVDTRPRNPDGTFAPKVEGEAPAPPVAREPFEGFGKLDPSIQAQFNRLTGERDDLKLRYTRLNGEYRRVARQTGSGREAQTGQPQPRSGATQVGQAADGARQGVRAMQPGPQRDAAQRQVDAWDAHARQYPDDAKAIEQRLGKLADDIANGLHGPLMQEIQTLRGQLDEMRGGYEAIQAERAERISHEHQQTLEQVAGDNWRQIAGWEDEHGNPIPREQWDWHPDFKAWVNRHDPDEADEIWERLGHRSPKVVGKIIADFNRAHFGESNGAPATGGQVTPADPQAQRRADNLRDVAPSGGGTAKPSAPPVWQASGNAYVDAVRSPEYREWQKA